MHATPRILTALVLASALGMAAVARAQTITCDVPLSATIDQLGLVNQHQLAFDVVANEIVAVNVIATGGTNFDPRWRLLDHLGQPVTDPDCNNLESGYRDCGPLPVSGNPYRLEVSESGANNTGTYELIVEPLTASGACEALATPCNDKATVSLDNRTSMSLHKFDFEVDASNTEIVSINVVETAGASFDPRWRLIDKNGAPVGDADCSSYGFGYKDCGPLPASGNPYRVQVKDSLSSGTGAYELFVQRLTAVGACEAIPAPCDGVGTNDLATRSASNLHQLDFPVVDNEIVAVNVVATAGTLFAPRWRLLDKSGLPVSDPSCNNAIAGYGDCGPLPASGNPYRVQVTESGADATGTYQIMVERLTASAACEALDAPCNGAVTQNLDSRTSVNLHQLGFDVDPSNTEIVSINVVKTAGTGFQPVWRLLDKTGAPVSDGDCNGNAFGYENCGPLPASGNPYRIQVMEFTSANTGPYEVFVQRLTAIGTCEGISAPCDGIGTGAVATGTASHLHQLSFAVVDNEILGVNVAPTSGAGFSPRWRLLDKTGLPVSDFNCSADELGYGDCGPLQASGNPYRIEVRDNTTLNTGTYEIQVARLTATVGCETQPGCAIANRTDSDLFEVTPAVAEGSTITVNVIATGGNGFSPGWRLIDRDGRPVSDTRCDGGEIGQRMCGPLAANGNPYRVQVTEVGSNNVGTMTVIVNAQSLCCGNGVLDVAEACDGSSQGTSVCCAPNCSLGGAGIVCRPSGGACDGAETCGAGGVCPPDVLSPAGTVCRTTASACDAAETCTGASAACPPDVVASSGTVCRAAVGTCDVAERCNGLDGICPPDAIVPQGTVCRAVAGTCDVAEACPGGSPSCPPDVFVSAGTECRAAAGACDVAEACTGSSAQCPTNAFASSATICHPATGACDVAETCSGAGASCPPDALASATSVCRAAAGACDRAEVCDGTTAACPPDAVEPASTPCGEPGDGCRMPSFCSGDSAQCSQTTAKPDGEPCDDPGCDPSLGTCEAGVCKACAGDAQVAGAAGRVDVVCTLDDLSGNGTASCAAEGHLLAAPSLVARSTDDQGCVPGCPNLASRKVTKVGRGRFRAGESQRQIKAPTNRNGKQYLKDHANIEMGVCITVTDRAGRVRRKQCSAAVTKPVRKPRR